MSAPRLNSNAVREGVERRFETRIVPYEPRRLLLVLRDVTERNRAANRSASWRSSIRSRSCRTGMTCWQLLKKRAASGTTGERFAVVRINLDQFKRINDSIGTAPATRCCRPWPRASAPSSSWSVTARSPCRWRG
jgi:predicted signal transduction protein with EAL and GGDEF domain